MVPCLFSIDDEIFEHTMKAFPELAEEPYEKLAKLDEDWMKSNQGKKRWREFIAPSVFFLGSCFIYSRRSICLCSYEKKIKDYNFGSLIRTNARGEYGETNTIFGMTFFSSLLSYRPLLSLPPRCFSHKVSLLIYPSHPDTGMSPRQNKLSY